MGMYVITGGTKGIGLEAANYLKMLGHEVLNIDINKGDINADLGTGVNAGCYCTGNNDSPSNGNKSKVTNPYVCQCGCYTGNTVARYTINNPL